MRSGHDSNAASVLPSGPRLTSVAVMGSRVFLTMAMSLDGFITGAENPFERVHDVTEGIAECVLQSSNALHLRHDVRQ